MTPRTEREAHEALEAALATNEGRVQLFRQLASYEEADGFEAWCARWRHDPNDPEAGSLWSRLHSTYIVAWRELGSELFWRYMRLGHHGLRRGGT